ncbi:galactose oxidase-like domain-containing protein [Nocardia sp. NPDC060259]|uniref:galactose oxidase-like domain-containing protein n=1 Tax=Nocardia sp. NPDC060259 TaxID=3347088 RepID=UPI00365E0A3F
MPFATEGRWSGAQQTPGDSKTDRDGLGVFVIHATLLRTGEVLWFSGHAETNEYLAESYVWDPTQPAATAVEQPFPGTADIFCCHHANLDDGRVITVGGAMAHPDHGMGIRDICIFDPDPAVRAWTKIGDMQHGRWYPTLVTLGDGQLVVFSGREEEGGPEVINSTVELLSPPFTGPSYSPTTLSGADKTFPTYPGMHLVPGGRVVHTGTTWRYEDPVSDPIGTFSFRVTSASSGFWTDDGVGPSVALREEGTSVLLPPAQDGRILVVGGAAAIFGNDGRYAGDGISSEARPRSAEILDTRTNPATWTRVANMTHPRINVSAVLLPDGKVLVLGGHDKYKFDTTSTPSNQAELYDPVLNAWTLAATASESRMYHSAALLIPDGRVLVAGGFDGNIAGDGNRKSFEFYEPPYFFNADDTVAVRPTITSITPIDGPADQLSYGGQFIIDTPDAADIRKVALMRPGSMTHHTDTEQRYVALDFVPGPGVNQLTALVPTDPSVAPPGYYMLWIVDANNRPCQTARFVRLLRARCFVVVDKSHYSNDEVNAAIFPATTFDDAFYVVMDGFLPSELGITSATAKSPPPSALSPVVVFRRSDGTVVTELTAVAQTLSYEIPDLPSGVRQRFTFKYRLSIAGTAPFFRADRTTPIEMQDVTLDATLGAYVGHGTIRLHHQQNPYMLDGPTSWLSIDLQVFKVSAGDERFGQPAHGNSDESAVTFIREVLERFNNNPATGTAEFNTIAAASDNTQLEWSYTRDGQRVFNYAVAKVRYRGRLLDATDVRVFFRLFTVAATGTEFRSATTYRTMTNFEGNPIPVLGLIGSEIATIPFFATRRVDSSFQLLTDQTDPPNETTIDATGGSESTTFFGCWLDFNSTANRYPWYPGNAVGPYSSGLQSIATLINGRHQCLVAEIHFNPAAANPLVREGDSPGSSDKLAQRNLAIVYSTNPGTDPTRTVQHAFELKPPDRTGIAPLSTATEPLTVIGRPPQRFRLTAVGPDELMIVFDTLPRQTEVELFMPQLDADDIIQLSSLRVGPGRVGRVDEHTIRCRVGDVSYIPLPPFGPGNLAGLITLRLPPGVRYGQVFRVVLRQVSSTQRLIGAFELMVRVEHTDTVLAEEANTLAVARYVAAVRPSTDRWQPIFQRYLGHLTDRVRELGVDPEVIEPSLLGTDGSPGFAPTSRWCIPLAWLTALLTALALPIAGRVIGSSVAWTGFLVPIALVVVIYIWQRLCKPGLCYAAVVLGGGLVLGALLLALLGGPAAHAGGRSVLLAATLIVLLALAAATLARRWVRR